MTARRRKLWFALVALPLTASGVFLAFQLPGFRDAPAIWAEIDTEQDQDARLQLIVALELRGELADLDRGDIEDVLSSLDPRHRRKFIYLFPHHFVE